MTLERGGELGIGQDTRNPGQRGEHVAGLQESVHGRPHPLVGVEVADDLVAVEDPPVLETRHALMSGLSFGASFPLLSAVEVVLGCAVAE